MGRKEDEAKAKIVAESIINEFNRAHVSMVVGLIALSLAIASAAKSYNVSHEDFDELLEHLKKSYLMLGKE
jgi:hypothetical protein